MLPHCGWRNLLDVKSECSIIMKPKDNLSQSMWAGFFKGDMKRLLWFCLMMAQQKIVSIM